MRIHYRCTTRLARRQSASRLHPKQSRRCREPSKSPLPEKTIVSLPSDQNLKYCSSKYVFSPFLKCPRFFHEKTRSSGVEARYRVGKVLTIWDESHYFSEWINLCFSGRYTRVLSRSNKLSRSAGDVGGTHGSTIYLTRDVTVSFTFLFAGDGHRLLILQRPLM